MKFRRVKPEILLPSKIPTTLPLLYGRKSELTPSTCLRPKPRKTSLSSLLVMISEAESRDMRSRAPTLRTFRNSSTKKLTIDNNSISKDPSTFLSLVIPAESAKSLTSLNVVTSATEEPATIPTILPNQFVNLTQLCIRPLGNEMCDSITSANFQLQDLETVFANKFISESKYLDIFAAQSLRHLKKLSLKTYGLSKEQCRQIVIVVTSNLHSLQHLEVDMALDCSSWRLFMNMIHLRYLQWHCSYKLFDASDEPLPDGESFQKSINHADKAKKSFELAFADFAHKPRLDIFIYK